MVSNKWSKRLCTLENEIPDSIPIFDVGISLVFLLSEDDSSSLVPGCWRTTSFPHKEKWLLSTFIIHVTRDKSVSFVSEAFVLFSKLVLQNTKRPEWSQKWGRSSVQKWVSTELTMIVRNSSQWRSSCGILKCCKTKWPPNLSCPLSITYVQTFSLSQSSDEKWLIEFYVQNEAPNSVLF